jgi:hypothetical protein
MGPRRRSVAASGLRARSLPARSRVTVRRSEAPLLRSSTLAAALHESRLAVKRLEGELEAILRTLRDPASQPDQTAADRLRGAARAADAAFASLGASARR